MLAATIRQNEIRVAYCNFLNVQTQMAQAVIFGVDCLHLKADWVDVLIVINKENIAECQT